MQRTKLVQPEDEVSGELLFSAAAIYFVGNSDGENEGAAVGGSETGKPLVSLSWKMSALREVHRRWYQVGWIGGGLGGLQFNRPLQACTSYFALSKAANFLFTFPVLGLLTALVAASIAT